MKPAVVLPTLAMALMAVADTQKGPYTTDFNKYCSSGQQGGTIDVDGTKWAYECNKGVDTDPNTSFPSKTAYNCVDFCNDDPDCEVAVWHSSDGKCWLGKPSGSDATVQGSITMKRPDALATCQADLDKYKPVDALCTANDRKVAEVNGQRFYLACNRVMNNLTDQALDSSSLEECITHCNSGCSYVLWGEQSRQCWRSNDDILFNHNTQSYADWHVAFKVGS